MPVRLLLLSLAIAVAACTGARREAVPVVGAPGVTIPAAVARLLNSSWKGWQIVAPPAAEAAACSSRFDSPPAAVVTGDWNGDAAADLAFEISGLAGRRVVAALARLDGEYQVYEVIAVPESGGGVLGIEGQGGRYRGQPGGVDLYYGLDTIAFGPCSQPETAYFWTGSKFEARRVFD